MTSKTQNDRRDWRAQEMLLLQQVIRNLGRDDGAHDTALYIMLQLMSEFFGLNQGRIVLQHLNDENASIRYAYGMSPEQTARGVYAPGEGITGTVLKHAHMIVADNVRDDPLFLGRSVLHSDIPAEQTMFIALPVSAMNRTFGVLACLRARYSPRALHDDISLLNILATLTGQLLYIHENNEARRLQLQNQNRKLRQTLQSHSRRYGIVGSSAPLLNAVSELERVAHSNANVLLIGENGTGKEMFARTLHTAGRRVGQPFIKVTCGGRDEAEFSREIFGEGDTPGLLEQADGGTIFFDETAALTADQQTRLLRVLQENAVRRLDGGKARKTNVRIITATCRDLAEEVGQGRFDPDLYYRLYVVPIHLPALRDRRSDIPELTAYFMHRINRDSGKNANLSAEAVEQLQNHNWPGNVYELEQFLTELAQQSDNHIIGEQQVWQLLNRRAGKPLPVAARKPAGRSRTAFAVQGNQARPYLQADSHPLEKIEQTLAYCRGNKTQAAQMLGLSTRQLYYRLEKLKQEREKKKAV